MHSAVPVQVKQPLVWTYFNAEKTWICSEYVQEYAKELVWDKNFEMLDGSEKNQKIILAEQQKRMDKLMGKVDFIVTDAPLLLNTIYLNSPDKTAYTKEY